MQDLIDIAEDNDEQVFRFKRETAPAPVQPPSTSSAPANNKDDDKKCKQPNKKHQ